MPMPTRIQNQIENTSTPPARPKTFGLVVSGFMKRAGLSESANMLLMVDVSMSTPCTVVMSDPTNRGIQASVVIIAAWAYVTLDEKIFATSQTKNARMKMKTGVPMYVANVANASWNGRPALIMSCVMRGLSAIAFVVARV